MGIVESKHQTMKGLKFSPHGEHPLEGRQSINKYEIR